MSAVRNVDGDVTRAFSQKYTDMMPVEIDGVYSPDTLDCHFGPTSEHRNHLYTVITTDNQFYVGITGRRPVERWKEHLGKGRYSGATFLKGKEIAAFVLVKQRIQNAEEAENKLTLQLMVRYGVDNVDGGEYAVDRSPGRDLPLFFNPSEYDYVSDIESIAADPIPFEEAHSSVKKTNRERIITLVGLPFYALYLFIVNLPAIILSIPVLFFGALIAFLIVGTILLIIVTLLEFVVDIISLLIPFVNLWQL